MPTDPYFVDHMQSFILPMVELYRPECPGEHGCCCECDRCPSLDAEYGQPEGPVHAVQFGPWPDSSIGQILKARYANSLAWLAPAASQFQIKAAVKRKARYAPT